MLTELVLGLLSTGTMAGSLGSFTLLVTSTITRSVGSFLLVVAGNDAPMCKLAVSMT